MVSNLVTPHCVSFFERDGMSFSHPQNLSLHIEVFVHRNRVKGVLVDGGAGLNICTLSLVRALGYIENAFYPKKKITIKAYDDEERSSKGM